MTVQTVQVEFQSMLLRKISLHVVMTIYAGCHIKRIRIFAGMTIRAGK